MIVFGIKSHSSSSGDSYVTFSVAVPLGPGVIEVPGWIYFPATKRLYKPSRMNKGGKRLPSVRADKSGTNAVKAEIERTLALALEPWPSERVREGIVALAEVPLTELEKLIELVAERRKTEEPEEVCK